jgi:hypothetical protein
MDLYPLQMMALEKTVWHVEKSPYGIFVGHCYLHRLIDNTWQKPIRRRFGDVAMITKFARLAYEKPRMYRFIFTPLAKVL